MSTVTLTSNEQEELRVTLDVSDQPQFGFNMGSGVRQPVNDASWLRTTEFPVYEYDPNTGDLIGTTYERRSPGWGITVGCVGEPNDGGDTEIPQQTAWDTTGTPGTDPSVAISLREKLLTAAGEQPGADRRFSLRFSYARTAIGAGTPP